MIRSQTIYWDASAVLAVLFKSETGSTAALQRMAEPAAHLLSSLAFAEVHAVIRRAEGSQAYATAVTKSARKRCSMLWQPINASPEREIVAALAQRRPLRGADLWHLALTKTLARTVTPIELFSLDRRLHEAAVAEGLARPPSSAGR